jgi:serine phosphatase RsbU (regulator of sigma subunit)/anti-sigma regulatory factor (Ser/Thr protein kinase)
MSAQQKPVRSFWRRRRPAPADATSPSRVASDIAVAGPDIAPGDPILGYFQSAGGAVDIEALQLESPALESMRAAGIKLVVPLISQGELIGLLNLGPRLSEQEYSADDRKLLDTLAGQAAPAVRVAQLVRQQETQARERERVEQELRVAQLIQQQFLPRDLPQLDHWNVAAFYRPAREVGGDFYDFFDLPEGKVGLVVGDVTDKGVPAALVMATTHSLLRAEAPRLVAPSRVLEKVNELLVEQMPPKMFVTCLYAVLDTQSGELRFANAGHNLPFVVTDDGVVELRATGMPLGLMAGMNYEETEAVLRPGESMLLHSDGLAEAHSPDKEMFGFPRVKKTMENREGRASLIEDLLSELDKFTGAEWEQEDDITLVAMERRSGAEYSGPMSQSLVTEFEVPSEMGNERIIMDRVAKAVGDALPGARLDKLKTAVSEAGMNAIEHGNQGRAEIPVAVQVLLSDENVIVRITDQGGDRPIPEPETPDLEAKLEGLQSPRGWGLFLIENMVDEMNVSSDRSQHTIELVMQRKGG